MRDIPDQMQADLSAGLTHHCRIWRLERADGQLLGFTDHDRPLEMDGLVCRPGAGPADRDPGAEADGPGGPAELSGVLEDEAINAADLAAGLWDGAAVQLWRVDWRDAGLRALLWSGRLSAIAHGETGFTARLDGPAADLDRVAGRVYGRLCDAALGDARCGAPDDHPAFGEGCDQRFATCRDRFGNSAAFRGFPYLLGFDALIAPPGAEARPDGGSRGLSG